MLNTIVIEEERTAIQQLENTLKKVDRDVQVLARLSSVEESLDYFSQPFSGDIIFSEIQLRDGLSFEIFSRLKINIPVIFITRNDNFILHAFEYNGIDCLLKPVNETDLQKALLKYHMLENHFTHHPRADRPAVSVNGHRKLRLIVKKGTENISLRLDDIVLFYTENKIVYVVDQAGKKYRVEKNLREMEDELDNSKFFRANRQYIININFVKGFKTFEKVKLQVDLKYEDIDHPIIVSQETAPLFRKWIYEA